MAENSDKYTILVEKPKGNRTEERLVINRMIILKRSLNRMGGRGLNLTGSGYGQVAGLVNTRMSLRAPYNSGNFLNR
jgi:hypothetical protein